MVLGEVAFEGSGAALPGEAGATVESVANYVTANPGVRIEIATHADKAGADLAKERAQAVRAALLGAGVKEDQVVVGAPAAGDGKAAQRVELLLAAGAAAAPAPAAATAPAAAAATGGGSKADGKGIYDKTCVTCHSIGVAGAPKVGDKAAWAPRLAGGVGALVQSAIKGKGAMPPKGGNAALSEAEIKAAVEHMVASSK
jgi:cytochrome c5